ncbi:metal ABC transporter permease [Thermosediminibacter litoriperuensis]|uniref:Zinc transport system permease protein n=1 Tax=Thermosediminibacter litoriperuensis TaxID=291989 RepID=A0A5S5ANK2_9FIRM|nr:metal ABC transporter permease [Thermosediminibacter litoriperuensis]TYP51676.1 zinc transport system permease protein [Thermosediminibacter litoriperuensis]
MEIFAYSFMVRAFIAGVAAAVLTSTIGVFVVLRRMSIVGDSLSHASLAGVAAGMLFGFYPFYGALLFSVLAALLIEVMRAAFKRYAEVAIAVVMSAGMGTAVVLISLGKSFNADLFSYLFGSLMAVTPGDIKVISTLGLFVIASIILLRRELFAVTFDEDTARLSGIPVKAVNAYFSVITALTVALSVRVVGTLLVSALIVIPAAVSLQLARSFRSAFFISNAVAIFSVVAGLYISFYLDLAPGGTIVLIASSVLFMVLLLKKGVRKGWN